MFTQEHVQTIPLPASLEPKYLSTAFFTLDAYDNEANEHTSIKITVGCKESVLGLAMLSLDEQVQS
jgi:hypothetical protein